MTETKSREKITVIDLPVTALRSFEEHPYKVVDNEEMQPIREEIYTISAKIKPLRKEQKMCKDIYERSTAVARTVEQIEFPKPPEKAKQQTRNHGWGSR